MKTSLSFIKKHDDTLLPLAGVTCVATWFLADLGIFLTLGFAITIIPITITK